jgi:hypothetical protein
MEFLRFGSSIPGSYWGCCAVDIIQNFKQDPASKTSIQVVNGDSGQAMGDTFVSGTQEEVFLQRLRFGTFSKSDMPNHAFIAILTDEQIHGTYGKKWLAILKREGFEFIRSVTNSVYSGSGSSPAASDASDSYLNHIFMLVRNCGTSGAKNPFMPPKVWQDLPSVVPEVWATASEASWREMTDAQRKVQYDLYKALPGPAWKTAAEVKAEGIEVILAGMRSQFPQQTQSARDAKLKELKLTEAPESNPFDEHIEEDEDDDDYDIAL